MAWNEPGNGKGKGKDPWGDGGRNQGPDVDEFLRKLKNSMSIFGGRKGSGGGGDGAGSGAGGIGWLLLGLLVLWVAFDSWHMVDERQRGVVLRFGEYDRLMPQGLNLAWPRPIEQVHKVDVTSVRAFTSQSRVLTRDENIVIVDFNVQYQVMDPVQFLFGARNPEEILKQASESAVRGVIGTSPMEVVLSGQRAELIAQARDITQTSLELYRTGLQVTDLSLQNARPPGEVREAFDDAISAREDRQRIENEARAYASRVIPEARGQAARVTQEAEAYRDALIARATGEADRFSLLVHEYRRAPEVTRKRLYLETMQEVLANNPKVLMDDRDGNNVLYLPLDRIGGGAPRPGEPGMFERLPPTTVIAPRDDTRAGREAQRPAARGGRP
ncbi:MAG TPA: FtsH protease activity modulator HflK [Xanthomonadaceae bacterium]|nr:FtsH protease activity modulator HflK [Xanthomonadaceae bacterium]